MLAGSAMKFDLLWWNFLVVKWCPAEFWEMDKHCRVCLLSYNIQEFNNMNNKKKARLALCIQLLTSLTREWAASRRGSR